MTRRTRPDGARRMTRRAFALGAAAVIGATAACAACRAQPLWADGRRIRWVAFYGVEADESAFRAYDLVVLDPGFRGSIARIADGGACLCGYVSLGEIRTSDPAFAGLSETALLPPNPDWPGTRRVDVRSPDWRSLVLDRQIPALAALGFTGVMLDTLDTPPYLEAVDPGRNRGMRAAAAGLVRAIRKQRPDMTLIVNRGYALLPDVVEAVDAVVAESLLTRPDLKTGGFSWVGGAEVETQIAALDRALTRRPQLPILSLDYWNPKDRSTIREIYRRERAFGHHPYVGTRLLDQIVPEES